MSEMIIGAGTVEVGDPNDSKLLMGRIEETAQVAEVRPIEVITAEIWLYKQHAGAAILEIGRRLIEAKAQLSHGEWLPWLEEKVEFSEVTAQRFMRLAREYENPSLVTGLGASKALILLALPASEREEFVAEKHQVNGVEKSVLEMSKRELEKAIKERDDALNRAAEAEHIIEVKLEEQRSAFDAHMEDLRDKLQEAESEAERYQRQLEEQKAKATADIETAQEESARLLTLLEELQKAPREVETVVDQEAVSQAADAARKEMEAKLKGKLEKAEKAKEKAEQAKNKAEQELASLKVAQEEATAIAKREKQTMEEQMQTLQKKLAVASSSQMTIFKLHFDQGQGSINSMTECIGKLEKDGNAADAEKLKGALRALLTATLEVLK